MWHGKDRRRRQVESASELIVVGIIPMHDGGLHVDLVEKRFTSSWVMTLVTGMGWICPITPASSPLL
ncbi:hypothetical protein SERLA73DRAFT_120003 [Serpula lacrymans var. lacrymans S7.3]|uniref:Uncharacterized protein n=1 Tax=Serpula lacrymans var. lacrymans (strain S7.3) TaxID=936435 RepID=F8PN27_SERL3|nr:hypothetical protein SERLA73DRAFT_120003 [Serpula lacrymans var. lacrymans S7.3]